MSWFPVTSILELKPENHFSLQWHFLPHFAINDFSADCSLLPFVAFQRSSALPDSANLTPALPAQCCRRHYRPLAPCSAHHCTGAIFSLQHLSFSWNEEEMPPRGLTSSPSWGWAEIDSCDPAVLIYSPHPHGYGRLHLALLVRGSQKWEAAEKVRCHLKDGFLY